jgi:hypothetical protein
MTDTIIQFKYSDDVHMVALYIKSDTYHETFIPLLFDSIKKCEYTNRNRGWSYAVVEIISKITKEYESLVSIILESQIKSTTPIYKYEITITEDIYNNRENKLVDYCRIKSNSKNILFDGLFKDLVKQLLSESNEYRIKQIKEDIEKLQSELDNIKSK